MAKWTLTIEFSGGFHVGSGYGFAGRIDRALLRGADDLPVVPGSSLKGKLRHAAREIAGALGHEACANGCSPAKTPCIICNIFGSPFLEGKLRVSGARCTPRENPVLGLSPPRIWEERNGAGIERKMRVANRGSLFRTECAPERLKLTASIEGDLSDDERGLLQGAVKTLRWLGADSSRGLGGCRCSLS